MSEYLESIVISKKCRTLAKFNLFPSSVCKIRQVWEDFLLPLPLMNQVIVYGLAVTCLVADTYYTVRLNPMIRYSTVTTTGPTTTRVISVIKQIQVTISAVISPLSVTMQLYIC